MSQNICQREYDFALIIDGVFELTAEVEDALFESDCRDATFSIQYGRLYGEFSRQAESFQDAILSAIRDVLKANIGAEVLRVDECNLVTPAEIARRIGRTRQLVHQYITGACGPGNFPPPNCHLTEGAPLWAWCAVSFWFAQNAMIRPEEGWNATVVAAINNWLEHVKQQRENPQLLQQIEQVVARI